MKGVDFLENVDMMVLASIIVVVILAFVLVVIVFTIKFKTHYERIKQLQENLDSKSEKSLLLEESLSEARILNATHQQELNQQDGLKAKLQGEIDALTLKLQTAEEKIENLNSNIVMLEKSKSELGASLQHTKESVLKLEDTLEQASKRNEFWVEQMTEVRTKYEALKLKIK
jgi:chromosome segregation ATPase